MLDFKEREKVKIAAIIDKYGPGFDDVYWEGKYEGRKEAKTETAINCLKCGLDEDIISSCTGISISELEKLKKEL